MRSLEALVRIKKLQVDEKRLKVDQIKIMIAEFDRKASELDLEIHLEEDRAGIHDPAHLAYPTWAKAALARRENLKRSSDELRIRLKDAESALSEAFEDLKTLELRDVLCDVRDLMRERENKGAASA
jgi:flagellar protein FliJ